MPQIFKVVLTGGPCGGKTTGQARLCSFFESLGWKVYRTPETATILLSGGVKFPELNAEQTYQFQLDLLKVMLSIEKTFDDLARTSDRPCLVICDRGCMDAVSFMTPEMWERAKRENAWNDIAMRDSRYDLIVHMVSAARGAEDFYTLENNNARMENDLDLARDRDEMAARAWLGHPYFEVVDNSTGFEEKIRRMISLVCTRMGVNVGDRLAAASRKRKFLLRYAPSDELMRRHADFIDFEVEHDYLSNSSEKRQSRIRKRGRNGAWTYQHTMRYEVNGQIMETKTSLPQREYKVLLRTQRSPHHYTVYKTRRCFLFGNQYYQLDTFRQPCRARCRGLVLLETYTTTPKGTPVDLPDFLEVIREVTGEREYSMFTLSLINERSPPINGDVSGIFGNPAEEQNGAALNGSANMHVEGSSIVNALTTTPVKNCCNGAKTSGTIDRSASGRHKSFSCDYEDLSEHQDASSSLPQSPMSTARAGDRDRVDGYGRDDNSVSLKLVANPHTITTVVEEGMVPQQLSVANSSVSNGESIFSDNNNGINGNYTRQAMDASS